MQIFNCTRTMLITLIAGIVIVPTPARAQQEKTESLEASDKGQVPQEIISGTQFMSSETQAMQKEDFRNPAMKLIKQGKLLWEKKEGEADKACVSCHNEANNSMAGIAVRYPVYNKELKKMINVENRINLCRTKHMKALPWRFGAPELIAMTTYVKHQSRGKKINIKVSGPVKPFFEKGRREYERRRGQLNISCSQCHDKNYGKKYGSQTVTQGHSNGYPAYIVDQNKTRSLHWRIATCNKMIRSDTFVEGADDYVNLELYLSWRGNGLEVETPAVREQPPIQESDKQ